MPEGPEVYNYTEALNILIGKTVKFTLTTQGKYSKAVYDELRRWTEIPHTVNAVNCKGKNTFIISDLVVRIKYGLTGCIEHAATDHLILGMQIMNTDANNTLYFNDQMRFGDVTLMTSTEMDEYINILGPDIMHFQHSTQPKGKQQLSEFIQSLRVCANTKPIGIALADQYCISGIGNYLRAEILHLAKINPFTKTKNLSDQMLQRIYDCTVTIRNQVISQGDDYQYKVYQNPKANKEKLGTGTIWYM